MKYYHSKLDMKTVKNDKTGNYILEKLAYSKAKSDHDLDRPGF